MSITPRSEAMRSIGSEGEGVHFGAFGVKPVG